MLQNVNRFWWWGFPSSKHIKNIMIWFLFNPHTPPFSRGGIIFSHTKKRNLLRSYSTYFHKLFMYLQFYNSYCIWHKFDYHIDAPHFFAMTMNYCSLYSLVHAGVFVDSNLNWKPHLDQLWKKLCSGIYVIYKIKYASIIKTAKTLHFLNHI